MYAAFVYRKPMDVNVIHVLHNGDTYPICPRCMQHLEREYMSFCNSCGQNLRWTHFDNALVRAQPFVDEELLMHLKRKLDSRGVFLEGDERYGNIVVQPCKGVS